MANVPAERQEFSRRTMGTVGSIVIDAQRPADVSARRALDCFSRVDSLMSNWTSDSEVARLNRDAAAGTKVHEEVALVLAQALRIGAASGGAFDITVEPLVRLWGFLGGTPRVPSAAQIQELLPRIGAAQIRFDPSTRELQFLQPQLRIDLGGIAKGHAVDQAIASLRADGVVDALVDLSGNMRALGHPQGRPSWSVGVRDPQDRMPYFLSLQLQGDAIATSGNYEQFVAQDGRRYGHILDPRDGWPVDELLQTTVLAPTALEADAWATALMVLGWDAALVKLSQHPELQCILVRAGKEGRCEVAIDARLADRVEEVPEAQGTFELHWVTTTHATR